MSAAGLPADLIQALRDLAEQSDPAPEPFERVARWRRACGDAEAAATWQTWSLLPPTPEDLRSALATIWSALGQTDQAALLLNAADGNAPQCSWVQLALLLQQGDLEQATALQQQLLQNPPTIPITELLNLVRLWQESTRSGQALELLQPLLSWITQRGETPTIQVCLAVADLLEQEQRFDEAEPWWQRSHAMQPDHAWPLMRLGHQALRKQQPAVALHYARQVLQRNPAHEFAPRLQRKALVALGAERSLALLDGTPLPQHDDAPQDAPREAPENEGPALEWRRDCSRLALIGIPNTRLLQSWSRYLSELDPAEIDGQGLQLWLIDCPDPLWLEQQAQALLAGLPQQVLIRSWPVWDDQLHGDVCRTLEATSEQPFWRERVQRPQEQQS